MRLLYATVAFVIATVPLTASAAPTTAELAASEESEQRGEEMFAYDQAAWHATDQVQEDMRRRGLSLDTLQAQGMAGYIVEPGDGGSLLVTFYGERDRQRFALARYTVVGSTVTSGGFVEADDGRDMSLLAQRMINAREKAITQMQKPGHGLCSQSPANTLVLPPRRDGTLPIYILTSTTERDTYPAGGHYKFDFDADGKLVGERRFMKSCFNLDYRPKDGTRPQMVFLTHLLDSQPTEIHAFVSRNVPLALMIATVGNSELWTITDGHIEYSGNIPNKN